MSKDERESSREPRVSQENSNTVLGLAVGFALNRLQAGIENVYDQDYWDAARNLPLGLAVGYCVLVLDTVIERVYGDRQATEDLE